MKIKIFALAALISSLLSAPASAALYQLNATEIDDPDLVSNFSILFNDTGDGILTIDEVISFSGVTLIGPPDETFPTLLQVPDITGISQASPLPLFFSPEEWGFSNAGGDFPAGFDFWEYNVSPVPLPGALPLFASALGVMGLLGWRRKRKHAAAAAAA